MKMQCRSRRTSSTPLWKSLQSCPYEPSPASRRTFPCSGVCTSILDTRSRAQSAIKLTKGRRSDSPLRYLVGSALAVPKGQTIMSSPGRGASGAGSCEASCFASSKSFWPFSESSNGLFSSRKGTARGWNRSNWAIRGSLWGGRAGLTLVTRPDSSKWKRGGVLDKSVSWCKRFGVQ